MLFRRHYASLQQLAVAVSLCASAMPMVTRVGQCFSLPHDHLLPALRTSSPQHLVTFRHTRYSNFPAKMRLYAEAPSDSLQAVDDSVSSLNGRTSQKRSSSWSVKKMFRWMTDANNRKRFASMGTAGMLSYGLISNVNYIPLFSVAWYLVSVRTQISPLQQWNTFMGCYLSLWVVNNALRPVKVIAIAAFTPVLDRLFTSVAKRFNWSKQRAVALIFLVTNLGVTVLFGVGVLLASLLSGVPIW